MLKSILNFSVIVYLMCFVHPIARGQLSKAVSHNDYLQRRPLMDALEAGYTNIEADIFLRNGKLIVAHWFPYGKNQNTLEKLYLLPLSNHIANVKKLDSDTCLRYTLLVDIKSAPIATYLALKKVLLKYQWMLSSIQSGAFVAGHVTIVLTGRKPVELISQETNRLVMIDDFLNAPSTKSAENLFAMASCKYSWLIKSKNIITESEKDKLRHWVDLAHFSGKKARLWASPEKDQIRADLLECGIDLINTDHLSDLKIFLKQQPASNSKFSSNDDRIN